MTDPATILCKRCGFANAPGDQFCGSCGAFLEWEGQPSSDAPDASGPATAGGSMLGDQAGASDPAAPPAPSGWTAPIPPSSVAPAPVAPGPIPVTRGPSPAPAAQTSSAIAPAPASPAMGDDLVRCPACGIANPATRTFCQSCGTTLAAASRVVEPSADEIAAALAATPVPTAGVPPAGARPATRQQPASRGIPGWIFAIGLLGILVGVGIVLIGPLIAGAGPGSEATSGPSATASGGPSAAASGAVPGGSGASPAATPKSVKLKLTGAAASSVLGDKAKYRPEKAIDGDLTTSWQEGSAQEQGQWIEVSFDPSRADTLVIRNGYQASTALYRGNLRLRDIQVAVNGGTPIAGHLKDTTKAQRIDLGGIAGATSVRITIVTTYPSVKTSVSGTPFDDAAVSEISVLGSPGG